MPVPCADSGHSAGLASRSTGASLRRVAGGAGGGKEEKLHATCAHSPPLMLCFRLGSESDVCCVCRGVGLGLGMATGLLVYGLAGVCAGR